MKGKKSFFTGIFLLIAAFSCYGKNNFEILKKPNISVETSVLIPTQTSLKNEVPSFSSKLNFDFFSIFTEAGFRLSTVSTDTVVDFQITPLLFKYFKFGAGVTYHLYDYFKVFYENDFLFKSNIAYLYKDIIRFQFNIGYMIKLTYFKNPLIDSHLFYDTLMMGFDFYWKICNFLQLTAGANTIGYYDMPLFGTPFYNLRLNFKLDKKFDVGLDYNIKMIDMFAVAENISEMILTLYMKVSL